MRKRMNRLKEYVEDEMEKESVQVIHFDILVGRLLFCTMILAWVMVVTHFVILPLILGFVLLPVYHVRWKEIVDVNVSGFVLLVFALSALTGWLSGWKNR